MKKSQKQSDIDLPLDTCLWVEELVLASRKVWRVVFVRDLPGMPGGEDGFALFPNRVEWIPEDKPGPGFFTFTDELVDDSTREQAEEAMDFIKKSIKQYLTTLKREQTKRRRARSKC